MEEVLFLSGREIERAGRRRKAPARVGSGTVTPATERRRLTVATVAVGVRERRCFLSFSDGATPATKRPEAAASRGTAAVTDGGLRCEAAAAALAREADRERLPQPCGDGGTCWHEPPVTP